MGTHDQINNAEPQEEYLSGFKISQNGNPNQSFGNNSPKPNSGSTSQKTASGLQGQTKPNPYQLGQNTVKNQPEGKFANDPFEKASGPGFVEKIKNKLFSDNSGQSSTKQKAMVLMIPILAVVMIFMFRQVLSKPPRKTRAGTKKHSSANVGNTSKNEVLWTIPDPLPADIRDPRTIGQKPEQVKGPTETVTATEPDFMELKSIVISSDNPSVVINDNVVYLHQTIKGVTIAEINRDYIVCEKDGNTWIRKIGEPLINKLPEQDSQKINNESDGNESLSEKDL